MHIYDPTLRSKKHGPRKTAAFASRLNSSGVGKLHEVGLSADGGSTFEHAGSRLPAMTLEQMIGSNGHHCVDLLKIDVDGTRGAATGAEV